jgi:phosphoribosylaminoimidazole carboxylase
MVRSRFLGFMQENPFDVRT